MNEQSKIDHFEAVAIRKSKVEGWRAYAWKRAGDDLIITGGVPTIISRGKNKGRYKWDGKGESVVVTRDERDAEYSRYVKDTGNCGDCYGEGRQLSGWSKDDGARYRECKLCNGTGRADLAAAKGEGA